eukprot:3528190-Amphidinium_carterae.1
MSEVAFPKTHARRQHLLALEVLSLLSRTLAAGADVASIEKMCTIADAPTTSPSDARSQPSMSRNVFDGFLSGGGWESQEHGHLARNTHHTRLWGT